MNLKKIFLLILAISALSVVQSRNLDEIKRSGKIRVAFTSDDIRNINYPLALEFAKYLNVELVVVNIEWEQVFMHDGKIPTDLESNSNIYFTPDALNNADIICSTFTILDWRKKLYDFAETLYSAELLLVKKGEDSPKNFADLAGKKITFIRSTTFEQHLNEINRKIGGGIELLPSEIGSISKEMFLNGEADGIVLDADEALNFIAQHDHNFQIAFPISEVTKTAWAVEKNNLLKQEVENFFETISSNGILDEIFYKKFEIRYSTFVETIHRNLRYTTLVRDLDGILESKKLVVALRDRNFIYRSDGQKQFMHALAEAFANHLGVSLEIIITPYFTKYWETDKGILVRDSSYTPEWFTHFDIACEVFAPLEWRTNKVDLIPIYPSEYSVIAKKETEINGIEDLRGLRCITGEKTVYEEKLLENGLKNYYYGKKVNDYLPEVEAGKADYTILYNAFYELSPYPDLETKIKLGNLNVCWGIRKDQPMLEAELKKFIASSSENGLIRVLMKSLKGNTLQSPDAYINSYYESFQTGQLPYVNYGADDGLPQEDVFSIFQDRKGYIWFGTNSGAVRYNGREMFVYNENQGLPSSSIRDINQDSTGMIIIATTNGISELDYNRVKQNYFKGISFKKILVDHQNNKWLIGEDGAYMLTKDNKEISINSKFPELPGMIYDITEDPKTDNIFLATPVGVFLLKMDENILIKVNDKDAYSVFVDVNDSIWISTKSGLYISDLESLKTGSYLNDVFNLNYRLDFPIESFSEIKTNNFGSVWLISDSKIYQVISTDQKPVLYEEEIGIKNNKILSFFADKEDNLWIGFSGGLKRLTNRKGLRNFYPNTINSYIYSIFSDNLGRLWINSNNGIYYFDKELHPFNPPIGVENRKFLATLLSNGNILLVNSFGVYEINISTLGIARYSQFPQLSVGLENVFVSSKGEIFLLTGINGVIYYLPGFYSQPQQIRSKNTTNINQLTEYHGRIIGGNNSEIVTFDGKDFQSILDVDCNVWSFLSSDTTLWVGTDCGLGHISNDQMDKLEMINYNENVVIKSIVAAKNKNYLWLGTNKGFSYFNVNNRENDFQIDTKDGLSGDEITSKGLYLDNQDLLWIGTYHGLSNFNIRAKSFRAYAPVCYIERIELNGERIDPVEGKTYRHNQNNFMFEISALSFTDEESVEYEFYLRGTRNNYSSYHRGDEFRAYYNNLPAGDYKFIYKAKGKNNIWGYAESFGFSINRAWYNTWLFRILLLIVIISSAYLVYKRRIHSIENQKIKLGQEVDEKKSELESIKSELKNQNDQVKKLSNSIEVFKNETIDSIQSVYRLQKSMLPPKESLLKLFPGHFILFKPKNIVSGDFYWVAKKDDLIYFTAADCTGHGIQGALMSILGIGFLNDIIHTSPGIEPEQLLNELSLRLFDVLQEDRELKEVMDMIICRYDQKIQKLSFAGSNNALYHVRNSTLKTFKGGSKTPLKSNHVQPDTGSPKNIDILPNDRIYIFSDGYPDQFGGAQSKKMLHKNFQDLLLKSSDQSMSDQCTFLNNEFENWKGNNEQIDDVLIFGVKF